jgi:hypothetical protein
MLVGVIPDAIAVCDNIAADARMTLEVLADKE